jgi:hypothetical protein
MRSQARSRVDAPNGMRITCRFRKNSTHRSGSLQIVKRSHLFAAPSPCRIALWATTYPQASIRAFARSAMLAGSTVRATLAISRTG